MDLMEDALQTCGVETVPRHREIIKYDLQTHLEYMDWVEDPPLTVYVEKIQHRHMGWEENASHIHEVVEYDPQAH